ncbi:MAG: hypothetical protein IJT52_03735 [Spirochaetales bacterium]|nr:hypothetical protein [Spirochaetales bacterium]
MFIKKIMRKDGVTVVVYEDNGSVFTIKTAEEPKASLLAALLNLRQPLLRNLGIPLQESIAKDYKDISFEPQKRSAAKLEREQVANLFDVCGLVHSFSEKNGESFRILGIFSENTVKTSTMTVAPQGDSFWDGKDPKEFFGFLTPEDMENIKRLLSEAEDFVDGAREQGQLFDTEGNPTEDADNEEDQEAF